MFFFSNSKNVSKFLKLCQFNQHAYGFNFPQEFTSLGQLFALAQEKMSLFAFLITQSMLRRVEKTFGKNLVFHVTAEIFSFLDSEAAESPTLLQ